MSLVKLVGIIGQSFRKVQKMAKPFNSERAALILAEAALHGDVKAASKWEVSQRTISNYRRRMDTDEELSALFDLRRQQLISNWALSSALL